MLVPTQFVTDTALELDLDSVPGLTTVMVPSELSVIAVGPVYRQPFPPRPTSASALMATLLGGIVSGLGVLGVAPSC